MRLSSVVLISLENPWWIMRQLPHLLAILRQSLEVSAL
ncbi:Uncharacterised protein [Mycobacterium tuberculosis]|nr:Uncharacterised protein [Mycobacterium tuberculosis]